MMRSTTVAACTITTIWAHCASDGAHARRRVAVQYRAHTTTIVPPALVRHDDAINLPLVDCRTACQTDRLYLNEGVIMETVCGIKERQLVSPL